MPAALQNGEFSVYYQPLVSCTGALHGCEALLRWRRRDGTVVPPADFIPVAERSGFIIELGDFVLREALKQLSRFDAAGLVRLDMGVNVSGHQLAQADFECKVRDALAAAGIQPQRLVLEITESVTVVDEQQVTALLSRLAIKGVRVALDDFGTGYSNAKNLKNYPVSALKIDRAFVQGVVDEEVSYVIVRAIINMAKELHLETFAEGVETALQAKTLCEMGVDYLQGYLYGRPMPAANLLNRFRPQPAMSGGGAFQASAVHRAQR